VITYATEQNRWFAERMLHECCSSILVIILNCAEVCWIAIPPCADTLDLDLDLGRVEADAFDCDVDTTRMALKIAID